MKNMTYLTLTEENQPPAPELGCEKINKKKTLCRRKERDESFLEDGRKRAGRRKDLNIEEEGERTFANKNENKTEGDGREIT